MGILLLLLGLLAAVSGGLKLRPRVRDLVGVSRLTYLETAAGMFTVLWSGAGLGRVRPVAWTVVAVVTIIMLLSTTLHLRRALERQRRHRASEAHRLQRYLER